MTQQIELKEYCNIQKAKWLLKNHEKVNLGEGREIDDKTLKSLKSYLKEIIKSKNGIVKRNYISKRNGKGRMYLDLKYGFQNMMREYRHTLASDDYYDIDMKNCHPVLFVQYCQKHNIKCIELEKYINDRDLYLSKYSIKKEVILKMINGGPISKKMEKNDELLILYKEINKAIQTIVDLNQEIKKEIEIKDPNDKYNINGRCVSYLLTEIENDILMKAYDFFKKKNYEVSVLCFDGLMIRKKEMSKYVLYDLNDTIYNSIGYRIDFVFKPMKDGYTISEDELIEIKEEEEEEENKKELIKQAKEEIKQEIMILNSKAELVIDNDKDGIDYILTKIKNNIIKSNKRYFLKKFESSNIYIEDISSGFKETHDYLSSYINKLDIKKRNNNGIIKIYSKDVSNADTLARGTFREIKDDSTFVNKMWRSNLGKLCFKNGYYEFSTKLFKPYDDDTYTPIFINYDYKEAKQEDIDFVYEKILDPIYSFKDQQEYKLNWYSRGLAGVYTEKTWAMGLGLRDSGKGVVTGCFKNTFGPYIGSFTAEELLCKSVGSGDISKRLGWMIPLEFTRLNFSNEVTTENDQGKKLKFDGNIIKSMTSGGDEHRARLNFKDEIKFKIQGRMIMNLNEVIECSPNDCNEKLKLFEYKNKFKKEDLTEQEKFINNNGGDMKILKGDDRIKDIIEQQNIIYAFLHIILNAYTIDEMKTPISMTENKDDAIEKDDNIENKILEYIEITKNIDDKILISDLNIVLKKHIKLSKIKLTLKNLGVVESKSNGNRYYRYIKLIDQD